MHSLHLEYDKYYRYDNIYFNQVQSRLQICLTSLICSFILENINYLPEIFRNFYFLEIKFEAMIPIFWFS